jgi:deazaflavin-dependent oxidoreductase (nitroreductase family)
MSRYTALVQRLGHQRWFALLGRRLMPVDRWLHDRTRGRWSVAGPHRLPSLLLTTTGRRSGKPRTQPLLYATDGDALVVIGSNWGQRHHPGWSANLLANPDATVCVHGRRTPVRATLATGEERARLWRLLVQLWPAYRTYQRRAAGRDIRIFRLTPNG